MLTIFARVSLVFSRSFYRFIVSFIFDHPVTGAAAPEAANSTALPNPNDLTSKYGA
jgi:hypothetical protein